MIFKDNFEKKNNVWFFGEKNLHLNDGNMFVHEKWVWPHFCISPLPTVINPAMYQCCNIKFSFYFAENVASGRALFVMFKKYHYTCESEAPLKIYVSPDGHGDIVYKGTTLSGFDLCKDERGRFCVDFGYRQGLLSIISSNGKISIQLEESDALSGYFGFSHVEEAKYYVDSFEFESSIDIQPYTVEEYKSEVYSFYIECAEYAEKRADEISAYHNKHDVKKGRCEIDVSPYLANKGESITIYFRYYGNDALNSSITLHKNYLQNNDTECLPLIFKRDNDSSAWCAEYSLIPEQTGNYKVVWYINGERISRVFGIIDSSSTVVNFWVGAHNASLYRNLLKKYDLPGDYHVLDNSKWIFGYPEDEYSSMLELHSNGHYLYGDIISPFVNGANILMRNSPDFNLFNIPYDIQKRVIAALKKMWPAFNTGELVNIGCYTHGANTIRAAEENGLNSIDSMCFWQNTEDFGWNINHIGSPIVPYFTSYQDFRKVGEHPVIMSSMGTATSVRSYDIYCYDGSPSNLSPTQRYTKNMAQHFAIERYYAFFDQFAAASSNYDTPVFFTAAIENFTGKSDWDMANEMAVDYIINKARHENIVFTRKIDVADYYIRNFKSQPKTIFFETDTYCGIKSSAKPSRIPDRIEIADDKMHCLFHEGKTLPVCFWDYTDNWEQCAWKTFSNRRNNAMPPEEIIFEESSPKFKDIRGVNAETEITQTEKGLLVTVKIDSDNSYKFLPLVIWNFTSCDFKNTYKSNMHFEKCVDSSTGNIHSVMTLFDIPKGKSEFSVLIDCPYKRCTSNVTHIGGKVFSKSLSYNGKTCLLLYVDNDNTAYEIAIGCDKHDAYVKFSDGTIIRNQNGTIKFILNKDWCTEAVFLFNISSENIEIV